jgi:hypothetical protein
MNPNSLNQPHLKRIAARAVPLLFGLAFFAGAGGLCAADVSQLRVYPNPARVAQGDTEIIFDNIAGVTVSLYTAKGELVREATLTNADTQFRWDLKNDSGREVASGVYVYRVGEGGDKKTGKVAVIR